jgi:DNA polymerase III gamma/tau subunit
MENVTAKKYSAIEMFNNAPAFRETRVKVDLPAEFFAKCKVLFPTAENKEVTQLKKNLNDFMMEKAQKKHKNYLRRQRAKQAKLSAQKEKELKEAENTKKEQQEQQINNSNKFETLSLSGSDSGVSVKSANSTKNIQKKKLNLPKVKTVQKYSVVKTPEPVMTPEVQASPSVRQPVFSSSINGNFRNQGKLRASTDDGSVIGSGSSSNVFVAKPVSQPRTWSNSRLNRQRRGRIGSRS